MEIIIASLDQAIDYQPNKPTYAIRICSLSQRADLDREPLVNTSLYRAIKLYCFNDTLSIFGAYSDPLGITPEIASQIVSDFQNFRYDSQTLLVHCIRGKNRSPAVALALNERFNLGNDSQQIKIQYPEYSQNVYELLKKVRL